MIIEYLKNIKKHRQIIITISVLTAVVTFIFTVRQSPYYNSSLALLVSNNQIQDTTDYRFDGYYTIQATDLFSNTVEAWFKSPEIVKAIYEKAKVDLDKSNIKNLTKIFKAEKLAPHYVEVRYRTNNEGEAARLASAVGEVLSEKAKILGEISKNGASFSIRSEQPVVALVKPPLVANTIVGLVFGFFLGFMIGVIKEYFRENDNKTRQE